MFIKSSVIEGRRLKALETGRSLEIHLVDGRRVDGIVDFISQFQGAATIFVDANKDTRLQLKVYSNRVLIELIEYHKDKIKVTRVDHVTVMSKGEQERISFANDKITHFHSEKENVKVPVEVGDVFGKHDKEFRVLAISRDGANMFVEDTISGAGLVVNMNDEVLIRTFRGFEWGVPTKGNPTR